MRYTTGSTTRFAASEATRTRCCQLCITSWFFHCCREDDFRFGGPNLQPELCRSMLFVLYLCMSFSGATGRALRATRTVSFFVFLTSDGIFECFVELSTAQQAREQVPAKKPAVPLHCTAVDPTQR